MLFDAVIVVLALLVGLAFGLCAGAWLTRGLPKPPNQFERWWQEREAMSQERRDWMQNRGLLPKTDVPGQDDPEYRTYMRNTKNHHENDPLW